MMHGERKVHGLNGRAVMMLDLGVETTILTIAYIIGLQVQVQFVEMKVYVLTLDLDSSLKYFSINILPTAMPKFSLT